MQDNLIALEIFHPVISISQVQWISNVFLLNSQVCSLAKMSHLIICKNTFPCGWLHMRLITLEDFYLCFCLKQWCTGSKSSNATIFVCLPVMFICCNNLFWSSCLWDSGHHLWSACREWPQLMHCYDSLLPSTEDQAPFLYWFYNEDNFQKNLKFW